MQPAQHAAVPSGTIGRPARCFHVDPAQAQRMEVVMEGNLARVAAAAALAFFSVQPSTRAQTPTTLDTAAIEQGIGLKGQFIAEENVFKVSKPRTDVKIQVDQWTMPPFMGLGSWAAFTPGHGAIMLMGDTVLF